MVGMVISHFGARLPTPERRGEWTSSVVRFFDGRAMPLFVVLAGIGFVHLHRRPRAFPRVLTRAVALLLLGLWLEGGLVAVILQSYALWFVVALAVVRLPRWSWLPLAGVVVAIGAWGILHARDTFDSPYVLTDDAWWSALGMLAHPGQLLTTLTFTGLYPLFPSFAFFLVGMWLAGLDLRRTGVAVVLVSVGLTVAGIAYNVGWSTDAQRVDVEHTSPWRLLSAAGHSNAPVWVVASTAGALAALGACLVLTTRRGPLSRVLADTGRLALTFYVAHVFVLRRPWRDWPWDWTPEATLAVTALLTVGFVVAAHLWRRRFAHGPLEALLRAPDRWWTRRDTPTAFSGR